MCSIRAAAYAKTNASKNQGPEAMARSTAAVPFSRPAGIAVRSVVPAAALVPARKFQSPADRMWDLLSLTSTEEVEYSTSRHTCGSRSASSRSSMEFAPARVYVSGSPILPCASATESGWCRSGHLCLETAAQDEPEYACQFFAQGFPEL